MNGLALHGGFIPFGGTFLVFSDYARNAMRMAALMELQVIHVLTHDSIGVGEDGPTHQPVEHTASLRLIPGMSVWRPCDATETAVAWKVALARRNGPTCLILSRQTLVAQVRTRRQVKDVARGGYILRECSGIPEIVFLATGSEVQLAMEAADLLEANGHRVRVVSIPCMETFEEQSVIYRSNVLPEVSLLVAVEAGVPDNWWRLVGRDGLVCGMASFGESAPGNVLWKHFDLTAQSIAARALKTLVRREKRRKHQSRTYITAPDSVVFNTKHNQI
jgi:transketolase